MRTKTVCTLAALLFTVGVARADGLAPDSFSLEYGTGNVTRLARGALQWDWDNVWFDSNGTHLGGYWDLSLAQWQARAWDGVDGHDHNLTDVGITPVFRFENDSKIGWYSELGVGAHYMNPIYDNNRRDFSTAFQFGDHLGFGYETQRWSVGVKLQHFSNGGIKHPNPGANFAVFGVDVKL